MSAEVCEHENFKSVCPLCPSPPLEWKGQCLVCETWFRHPGTDDGKPPFLSADGRSYGCFCPVCRADRMKAPGVVHFTEIVR